jgi:16S rRNA (cytidine1402-2'-O)-methyltransferase
VLKLIPTPIGNLEDITLRSLEALRSSELILAEDTRTTARLLNHYGIKVPMRSFHAHNEHRILPNILDLLSGGKEIALVSDAGTPGISDPGFLLVRGCIQNGIEVECLPGATALIPALINSGFPGDKFHFEGFLPPKKGRKKRWSFLSAYQHTIIIYESPYRLLKCLQEIVTYLGVERPLSVSRELTKIHEETIRGTAGEVLQTFSQRKSIKGEIVIVIAPGSHT